MKLFLWGAFVAIVIMCIVWLGVWAYALGTIAAQG